MSDLASPNTPSEALFNPAWVEDRTYLDPMDGSLDFNFHLTLPSNVDLFGNTNERAQADVQNPSQSISEWSGPSPGACNSPQAEQALEAEARSTNETPGLTSAGPQGTVPELPVSPESTTSQPQTVPDSPQGYWSSLLGGNKSTEDTMATLGNAQSPAGLTADLSGDIDLDLENFAGGPDPYPWGPLQENYRGPNLASETAMASSFIDPVQLASTGVQRYAGHTALNPAVQTPATHLNLALPGRAMWATPQVNCGNPINPGMTAVPWTRQAKASTSSGPVYPIRAPAATFAPPGTAESGAASLDLSLIDPDIMKELSGTHGPMVFGGTTAPQSVSASTPAGSRTMPHLTAPMAPPVIPARPIREGMPTRVQTERHSRPLEVQFPAQWTVPPPPACHPDAGAWDNIEPRKQMVLVHHRGGGTDVRPSDVYRPLKATPKAWGPPMFKDLFTYTEHGEWDPSRKFSKKDLSYYIINAREQAKRPLTIWIQHLPSQRNYRYPNAMSSKCRWDECPDPNHTILKGFYRVAFDEWSDVSGKVTDPFHNAGYMHLFCFEKMFDLFELIKYGYVRLEERNFPYENQNPMSVAEGHPKLTKTFQGWYYHQVTAYEKFTQEKARGGPEFRQIPREQRLWSVLTDRYISLESDARMKMRATRNGNSIEKHRGDLELFVRLNRKRKAATRQAKAKGWAWEEMENDESELEEHDARVKRARLGKAPARTKREEESDREESEPQQHHARTKRARLGKVPAKMSGEDESDSEELKPEQHHARAKRARPGKARAKKRVVVELDVDDSELEEKINRLTQAHHASLEARKRAAEAVDDGELRPGEDLPRDKCPRSSDRRVRSPSPARSHITVLCSDEEGAGPADEDPSYSSDDGEFEYEDL